MVIVKGKKPTDMKNKEDFYDVVEIVPGAPLMQTPDAFGCNLGDTTPGGGVMTAGGALPPRLTYARTRGPARARPDG